MKTPKFLLGCSLIFWGYFSNVLLLSILMAIILEIQPLIKWRRSTSNNNFYSIGDFSTIILVIIAGIALFNNQQRLFIYQIVAWLPFAFYPLILTEFYSDRDKTPLGAFIYRYRKLSNGVDDGFSLGYLFFFLCLFSASATTNRTEWFFPITLMLLAFGLWSQKSASTRPLSWILIFSCAASFGFVTQLGIVKLHHIAEEYSIDFIDSLFDSERDPFQTTTAMGRVGELKLSNRIVMRIKAEDENILSRGQPFLLQEAVYNAFYDNAWFNVKTTFESIPSLDSNYSWQLSTPVADGPSSILQIYKQQAKPRGLLSIPSSTSKIISDTDLLLSRNVLGAVQFRANPELEQYRVQINSSDQNTSEKQKTSDADLLVPMYQRYAVLETSDTLRLKTKSSTQIIDSIKNYFSTRFTYSTYQKPARDPNSALVNFLRSHHSGHCEFFASATVLLLRSAGIPARYTVGFSVQEYDPVDNMYIVRARHRHAWAKALVDGKWINVDTTPAAWFEADEQTASYFEPISDWISRLQYRARLWQRDNPKHAQSPYYMLIVIISLLFLFFKLKGKLKGKFLLPRNKPRNGTIEKQQPDTPYIVQMQRILDVLKQTGITWQAHEPLLIRAKKSQDVIQDARLHQGLNDIIKLYYSMRFNSHGLGSGDLENANKNFCDKDSDQLRQKIDAWLVNYNSSRKLN